MRDLITYPNEINFSNEVWECPCNFISHFTGLVITYPYFGQYQSADESSVIILLKVLCMIVYNIPGYEISGVAGVWSWVHYHTYWENGGYYNNKIIFFLV